MHFNLISLFTFPMIPIVLKVASSTNAGAVATTFNRQDGYPCSSMANATVFFQNFSGWQQLDVALLQITLFTQPEDIYQIVARKAERLRRSKFLKLENGFFGDRTYFCALRNRRNSK